MAAQASRLQRAYHHITQRREGSGLSQTDFWRKYGISQSAGSRLEAGGETQRSVKMLLALEILGYVSEEDLIEINKVLDIACPKS